MRALLIHGFLALVAALPAAALATGPGTVTFPREASVTGPRITVGEIATLYELDETLASRVASIELGRAAEPGDARSLTLASLRSRIHAVAPGLHVETPPQVRVRTEHREITPGWLRGRIAAALHHRMPWPAEAIELGGWRLPESFAVAAGARRLRVRFRDGEDFLGTVRLDLEWTDPDVPDLQPVRRAAAVDVAVRMPVIVIARDVRRGQRLEADDLVVERRDLARVPRDAVRDATDVLGMETSERLDAGQVVALGALAAEPVVRRGQNVRVEAGGSGLEVNIEARALERGSVGQLVQLENPLTRRRFSALLTGPGTARLPESGR